MVALTRLSIADPAFADDQLRTTAPAPPAKSMSDAARARQLATYGKLPLSFEPNRGQTDQRVRFISRGHGYALFLTGNEAVLSLQKAAGVTSAGTRPDMVGRLANAGLKSGATPATTVVDKPTTDDVLRMRLVGANTHAVATGEEELPGKSNYFIGNDPKKWCTNVPTYAQVKYQNVYPGVDLVYYGDQSGQLEYDFVVAPGADPSAILLTLDEAGQAGSKRMAVGSGQLKIDPNGDLVIPTEGGELHFRKPVVYQEQSIVDNSKLTVQDKNQNSKFENRQSTIGHRQFLDGSFVLDAHNRVHFALGPYDHTQPLVIDPTLVYSTYLGGSHADYGLAIAVDSSGNAYVTGYTYSTDFPTQSPYQETLSSAKNVFVSKLNAAGTALVYSTYLGGNGALGDMGFGIAVDSSGDAYVTGQTNSANFPVANALQSSCGGCPYSNPDAFVTKLNAAGSGLVYSTYLGGSGITYVNSNPTYPNDTAYSIAVDSSGNAYVTGSTSSHNFPTVNALQGAIAGGENAFVSELNFNSSSQTLSLVYSTYLGGNAADEGLGIAVDSSNNAYLTGWTDSLNFPMVNAYQETKTSGAYSAFVAKVNAGGSALGYSTYLGENDRPNGIAVDSSGDAYVTGYVSGNNLPTVNAYEAANNTSTGDAAFVTKFNAAGSALVYSTYLSGNNASEFDSGQSIAVDSSGDAYVTGYTNSSNFPTVNPIQSTRSNSVDNVFVTEFNPAGSALIYSTYLGGNYGDQAFGIAVDSFGYAYVTGYTQSTTFPTTTGAYQTANKNGGDNYTVFVTKLPTAIAGPIVTLSPTSITFSPQGEGITSTPPRTVTVTNNGTASLNFSQIAITGAESGNFEIASTGTTCSTTSPVAAVGGQCTVNVTFTPGATGSLGASLTFSDNASNTPQAVTLTGMGVVPVPVAGVSPGLLPYSSQAVGTSSAAQTVMLTNTGTGLLTITNISTSGDFSQTNDCIGIVAPSSTCTINVIFTPSAPGTRTGALTITDNSNNAPGSTQTANLTGIGASPTACPTQETSIEYGHLPLSFEANAGQTDSQVKFLSRGRGYGLFLTGDEAVLKLHKTSVVSGPLSVAKAKHSGAMSTLQRTTDDGQRTADSVLRMKLLGANSDAKVMGLEELSGKANYFIGNDPSKWVKNAPTYAKVRYAQVYPGIDLVYYGNQGGQLEYDFVVAPGADAGAIALEVGAALRIDPDGDLVIPMEGRDEVRFHKPLVYQDAESEVRNEAGNSKLGNRQSAIGNSSMPTMSCAPEIKSVSSWALTTTRGLW